MSRRPSFHHTHEEDIVLLKTPNPTAASPRAGSQFSSNRRASEPYSAPSPALPQQEQPQRVDWARTGSPTFLPLGFGADGEEVRGDATPGAGAGGRKNSYVRLDIDDPAGRRSPLPSLRIARSNRRTWERLIVLGVIATLSILLLTRNSGGGGGSGKMSIVQKTKMRMRGRKNPLKSSIPLHSFRSNLKEGHGYVTSFPYGGLTNQLIELFKLVHLGQRLDRTAILTELKAVHSEGGDLPLHTFFDLPSFAYNSNVSMVEWSSVKIPDISGTQDEILSCWGWRDESPLQRYNIKTWFWPPPGQLTVPSSIETSMTFPAIEVLVSQPQTGWLEETAKRYFGSVENAPPMPDGQLLCFENLFYVPSIRFVDGAVDKSYTIEEMSPEDPVWSQVGIHLHFNSHINHIADELLLALLGSRSRQPFIAVHLRQGDFVDLGRIGHEVVEAYKAGAKEVQEALRRKRADGSWKAAIGSTGGKGKDLPILFATDSEDPAFVRKLTNLGWIYINHIEFATNARFGGWYPGVLDSVILSRAKGLVGTKMSTFSYVAARRVEAWNAGVTTIVG